MVVDSSNFTQAAGLDSGKIIGKSKSKATMLADWQDAIRLGIKYRRLFGQSRKWSVYKNYYRGFFGGHDTVPVNIIYAIGRALIPQLYFRNPRVNVDPRRPGFHMHARMLTRLDNLLIQELNIKKTLKSMILDCYLNGVSMGIMGYDSEFGSSPSFQIPESGGDNSLSMFGKAGARIEYNFNVSPGMPWFLRVSPSDFIVPWGIRAWEEAPWFAFRKMRPLRDVKEDPKYENTKDLKGTFFSRLEGSDQESKRHLHEDQTSEWVELWQVHDQRTGFVYTLTLEHNKFLRNEFDELQIEGLPARFMGFNEDPDFFWWTPDARLIEQQQLEINDIRTMAKKHRRVGLLKVLYDKNMVSKDELTKFFDGDIKAAVAVDAGQTGDIRKAIALVQSHVPPDLSIAAREVREDVREIVGFSRNQSGSFEAPSGRRTATEANIVQAASGIRIDERRDIVADTLSEAVRGINQIIFKNWNGERVTDLIGPDGMRYWVRFTGAELRGEYHYKVNPEEATPSDQNTRRVATQTFVEWAKVIPGIDVQYLAEVYAEQFDFVDPERLFKNLNPEEGPGRSPEKALFFNDLLRQFPQGATSGQPGLK